jgi:hypothetical protein
MNYAHSATDYTSRLNPAWGLNTTTVSFWYNPSQTASQYGLFSMADGPTYSSPRSIAQNNAGMLRHYSTTFADVHAISSGIWYHVAIVRDGANQLAYFNGAYVNSLAENTSYSQGNIYFGSAYPGSESAVFDELRVSSSVRSSSWITAEYNSQNGPGNIGSPGFWTWGAWQQRR